jgi:hypothetical protein
MLRWVTERIAAAALRLGSSTGGSSDCPMMTAPSLARAGACAPALPASIAAALAPPIRPAKRRRVTIVMLPSIDAPRP